MPPSMPYHLETGETLLLFERYFNPGSLADRIARRRDVIAALQAPSARLETVVTGAVAPYAAGANARATDAATLTAFLANLTARWLGPAPPQGGLRLYDSDVHTGSWQSYAGLVEEILRVTLIRGLSASLKVSQGTVTGAYPISFIWKCSQPWFEGWVQWRTRTSSRAVVVVFCTPGDGNHVGMKPTLGYFEPGVDPVQLQNAVNYGFQVLPPPAGRTAEDLAQAAQASDSLVVTESAHVLDPRPASSTATTPVGSAPLPWFGGKFSPAPGASVITVSPATFDGGVS